MSANVPQSVTVLLTNTSTTTGNRVLAPATGNNRFFRGFYITNTGASLTVNVGVGAAANLTAANANVAFGTIIPANVAMYPIGQLVGQGLKALGAGSLNEVMGFASVNAQAWLTVVYSDDMP